MSFLAELTHIYIYPIKSMSGLAVNRAVVTQHGLAYPENLEVVDR